MNKKFLLLIAFTGLFSAIIQIHAGKRRTVEKLIDLSFKKIISADIDFTVENIPVELKQELYERLAQIPDYLKGYLPNGGSLLFNAILRQDNMAVRLLLAAKVSLEKRSRENNDTILHAAVRTGNIEFVDMVFSACKQRGIILDRFPNNEGKFPIAIAREQQAKLVQAAEPKFAAVYATIIKKLR